MKISGVIAEYNPFHNGHKYLIEKIKENSDAVVSVMSGSFVQRGEVAVFDKWTRAKTAVTNGVDLVLELPVIYAVSAAERFAFGAVELLSSLGCIDELCFGSESGDINELIDAGKKIYFEDEAVSRKIKENLSLGMGFAAARHAAYENIINSDILKNPNNILGIEYIKALLKLKSNIKTNTIKRAGSDYHSDTPVGNMASATALRKMLFSGEDISDFSPKNFSENCKDVSLYSIDKINDTLIYLLRTKTPEDLALINGFSEGLEYRLKELAKNNSSMTEIINRAVTKRYTKTRIVRACTALLLGIDKNIIFEKNSYIRVLAFNNTGREILKLIKENSKLPIITKTADYKEKNIVFEKDVLSTDVAALCALSEKDKTGGKDYTTPPVYINN